MGIHKRRDTNKWQAYYRDPSGRQRSKDFALKRDAVRWEASKRRDIDRGEWIDPEQARTTVGAIWLKFIQTRSVKASTLASYEEVWRNLIAPRWSDVHLNRVLSSEVLEWVATMEGPRGPVSGARARKALTVLRMVLDHAVLDRRLASNPAHLPRGTSLPKVTSKKSRRYLTHKEVHRLAVACGEHATLVLVLAYTGVRWGEAIALRPEDILINRSRIHVSRSYSTTSGKPTLTSTKNHQVRDVPMARLIEASLVPLMDGLADDDLIFGGPKPLDGNNFRRRVFSPALREAGLAHMTIHDLRHTAASLAVSSGATVKGVQRMLGHASAKTTLDTYADLFDSDLDLLVERLDEAFLTEVLADEMLTQTTNPALRTRQRAS